MKTLPPEHHAPCPADIHEYQLAGGWRILAGKTAGANDYLSLRLARPNDWWFHVRGMPGSHVLLQGPEGEEPPRKLLETAAAVAAWHSKARNGGTTAVTATQGKHVGKPRGAKPGTVSVRKETVFKIRPGLPTQEK